MTLMYFCESHNNVIKSDWKLYARHKEAQEETELVLSCIGGIYYNTRPEYRIEYVIGSISYRPPMLSVRMDANEETQQIISRLHYDRECLESISKPTAQIMELGIGSLFSRGSREHAGTELVLKAWDGSEHVLGKIALEGGALSAELTTPKACDSSVSIMDFVKKMRSEYWPDGSYVCGKCGHGKFIAQQHCSHEVIVDSEGNFEEDLGIYDSERPFGPYQCRFCGEYYDELEDAIRILPKQFNEDRIRKAAPKDRAHAVSFLDLALIERAPADLIGAVEDMSVSTNRNERRMARQFAENVINNSLY